jgi:hypothetical protein
MVEVRLITPPFEFLANGKRAGEDALQQRFPDGELGVVRGQKRSQPLAGCVGSEIYEALGLAAALDAEQGIPLINA